MSSIWIFLILMIPGTFFLGLNDVLVRKVLRNSNTNEQSLLAYEFIGVGVIGAFLLVISGMPELRPGFWPAVLISTSLNIFAQWAWYTAFKKEEASLISPLRLITPPIILFTGFLFLKETPSLAGVVGVLVTFLGLWLLFHEEAAWRHKHFLDVIKKPGVLLGIFGAVSFAISFPFDKKAVVASSALFALTLGFLGVGLANALISKVLSLKNRINRNLNFKSNLKVLLILPFIHTFAAYLTFQALNYSLAAYAGSVKRLWSLWAVILSGQFLNEAGAGRKLLATLIMLLGIAVTVFWG